MKRSVSQAAKVFGVEVALVKRWASMFADHLSESANPRKGVPRAFTDTDMVALCYVWQKWEDQPDVDVITMGLNSEDHFDHRFVEHMYLHTPLLQDPPENEEEPWRHGFIWSGGHGQGQFELARNYRYAADRLIEEAIKEQVSYYWLCPVLFTYRHTLELYLKVIGNINERTHSLARCVKLVEERHGQKFPARVKGWIAELDAIDPDPATTFRYESDGARNYSERWIDLRHFQFAMRQIFQIIDTAILRIGAASKH